jgi:DNA-binding GntR family transcriptional regulator
MSFQRHGIFPGKKRFAEALKEHRQIRDLIRQRDFAGAAKVVKQHEHNAGAVLALALKQLEAARAESAK